ncbi:hypothetical protein AC579_3178 [Pseudocercospora musae]|uniref:Uncharacterized protein n=1 Tax=Pseudocercospora musae TaxID=113226 RepID=A0A139H3K4_9PEZI|nr:hypothetical protein AC579_3178 [Pseudocercospora musae]
MKTQTQNHEDQGASQLDSIKIEIYLTDVLRHLSDLLYGLSASTAFFFFMLALHGTLYIIATSEIVLQYPDFKLLQTPREQIILSDPAHTFLLGSMIMFFVFLKSPTNPFTTI